MLMLICVLFIVYCVCLLFAPLYHKEFLVGENLLGSKNLSDSDFPRPGALVPYALRCPRCGARRSVLFGAARAVLPAAVSCLAWPRAAVPKPHVQHSGSAWCRELFTPL